jgi:uncharacterized coiled-coil protein SlyX
VERASAVAEKAAAEVVLAEKEAERATSEEAKDAAEAAASAVAEKAAADVAALRQELQELQEQLGSSAAVVERASQNAEQLQVPSNTPQHPHPQGSHLLTYTRAQAAVVEKESTAARMAAELADLESGLLAAEKAALDAQARRAGRATPSLSPGHY